MYRYTWFDKLNYKNDLTLQGKSEGKWVLPKDIAVIFPSTWEEHCLECSEPDCYGNCPYWSKRFDEKCKKTYYGFKRRKDLINSYITAVQFKFRPWAKIQTGIYPGNLSVKKLKRMDRIGYMIDRGAFYISHLMSPVIHNYKIGRAAEYFKNEYVKKIEGKSRPQAFLFQCYSEEPNDYKIMFEILKDDLLIYRQATTIKNGLNQELFHLPNEIIKELNTSSKLQMRYFPENNKETEILILFSDFICLTSEFLDGELLSKSSSKKIKCVAWDLDNTIWDGVIIESNPNELRLREGILETIKGLDDRGIIQIVVSKNDEDEVLPVLKRLGIKEYFIYIFANWNRKSENLKAAAEALNINVDTFALIDDSAFERGEVQEALPQVRVYDETIINELLSLPPFDVSVTADGKKRRVMYQQEAQRKELKAVFRGTDADFIKSCNMEIRIENVSDATEGRCLELVQRTNQLNLSGKKYESEEFHKLLLSHKNNAFVIFCRDKYGDYGQVGFMIIEENDESALVVSEYAVSCRVAEKWVEPTLLCWMNDRWKADKIIFSGVYNKKNDRLFQTLKKYGMKENITDKSEHNDAMILYIERRDICYPKVIDIVERNRYGR